MAVPDFVKAMYAHEEGKACVEGSVTAHGIFEGRMVEARLCGLLG